MTKLYSIKFALGSISLSLFLYAIFLLVQSPNLETKFEQYKVYSDSWLNYVFKLEKLSFDGYKTLIVGISLNSYIAVFFYLRFFNWLTKLFNEMSIQKKHKAEITKGIVKFITHSVSPLLFFTICYNVKDLNGAWVTGLVILSLPILQIVLDNEEDGDLVKLFRISASVFIPMQTKNMLDALVLSGFCGASLVIEDVIKLALTSLKPPKVVDTSRKEGTTPL